ncbi:hypothetical protein QJS83_14620 [Bdellovibrio sp. 22V]|uniref:hypothetical protein n=1 Tax=Bdellovibrio TaxID=958 RepID=UPI0025434496|nr:hypothetical protein [Bdellovibrio sp. 22V]WII71700.1 hypothetical protein QJS83_14620 [Bdellovibrio sp. 22V]
MKSMFSFSLGLKKAFSVLVLLTFFATNAQAIFIRGNGGFGIRVHDVWLAHDIYDLQKQSAHMPVYSPQVLLDAKVTDYIFRLQYPIMVLSVFKSLIITPCSVEDFNRSQTDYTYVSTAEQLKSNLQADPAVSDFALLAINFYDPQTKNYRVCTTASFERLSIEQKAVLLFHEIIYIHLEKEGHSTPTPESVRSTVVNALLRR